MQFGCLGWPVDLSVTVRSVAFLSLSPSVIRLAVIIAGASPRGSRLCEDSQSKSSSRGAQSGSWKEIALRSFPLLSLAVLEEGRRI